MFNENGIRKFDKAFLKKYFSETKNERIIKEIYIANTFTNQVKLFIMNFIEIFFLSFGLALSLQKDDFISFAYQLVIQVVILFAIR